MGSQFAPVAPVHILQDLLDKEALGDYHLLLAHHTVEKATDFRLLWSEYRRSRSGQYAKTTIIMDNSIVELGGAVDDKMIDEAVRIVMAYGQTSAMGAPTVIPVLPDVMGDGEATIDLSWDAYLRWSQHLHEDGMPGDGFMLVTQGSYWGDFARLVNHFFIDQAENTKRITWVGIPRKIQQRWPERTRAKAIKYIQTVAPHVKIHLLGFSDDITDDLFCASIPGVSGIDSAVPIRYSHLLTPLTTDAEIGPRLDWWENGKINPYTLRNLSAVRRWVGDTSR